MVVFPAEEGTSLHQFRSGVSGTRTSEAPIKSNGCSSCHLLFLLLLLLVIPALAGIYFLVRHCRRYPYHRLKERLKLWGWRQPGEVDNLEMGRAIGGGDWLMGRKCPQGSDANGNSPPVDVPHANDEFDPIHDEAEEQKKRWFRRRHLGDTNSSVADHGEATADATEYSLPEGRTAGENHGAAGMYNATTTRVWLYRLSGEKESGVGLAEASPTAGDKAIMREATLPNTLGGMATDGDIRQPQADKKSSGIKGLLEGTISLDRHVVTLHPEERGAQECSPPATHSIDREDDDDDDDDDESKSKSRSDADDTLHGGQ